MPPAEASLLGAAVSVLLPVLLGFAALTAIAPPRLLSRTERLGLAYPLGAVLITAPIYGLGYAGLHFDRLSFALIAGSLTLLCAAVALFWKRPARVAPPPPSTPPSVGWVLPAALSAVAVCTLTFVVFEVLHRPLSPADSFTVWALRAKVWAARGGLVLNPFDPFYFGRSGRAGYPPHISLLQTWTAVWLGGWNEVFVNLPWGCYYASALLFVFATLSRQLPRSWALCGACLLATTPLFVVHAGLAGYADLISAVHFAAAAIALYLWASEGAFAHLVIAALFAASLTFIKREGFVLVAVCAAVALMRVGWPRRRGVRWSLFGAGMLLIALLFAWRNVIVRALLLRLGLDRVGWHSEAAIPLLQSLAGFGSFQFLWPLFFVSGFITLKHRWGSPLAWLFAIVSAPLLPFCAVFLCTEAAAYAVNQGAPSRLWLQLTPAAVCFVVLAAGHLVSHAVPDARSPARRWKRAWVIAGFLALVPAIVLSAGGTSGLHWDLPSSDWRVEVERARGMLRYAGPPIDVDGSPGVAVTVTPGFDAGPMAIDWRRSGDAGANRVLAHLRRLRPFVFVDLSAHHGWAGRIVALMLTVPPELVDTVVGVDIPPGGVGARLWTTWQSFWTPEILDPRTMNVLEGAQLGGLPLALVAGGLWGVLVAAAACATWKRARLRIGRGVARGVILCTLALWTVCSARFAWDLLATYRVDQRRFSDSAENARLDTLGSEFKALVIAVQQAIPPDAPITFTSQFPLYSDRAQYAFYPRPLVNWILPLQIPPQYEVLFWPSPGSYDPRRLRILATPSKNSAIAKLESRQE